MRSLTTLREVKEIHSMKNADRIQLAVIDGWTAIVKKGEFEEGDIGVFFEIDSFLPAADERFEFLTARGTKTVDGEERVRIRTQRMRGELSQGLFMPLSMFPEVEDKVKELGITLNEAMDEGTDFSELLNVTKYERPEPKAPNASGNFPSFLQKTDENRIQNVYGKFSNNYTDIMFYPTLKLDGSSTTVAFVDSETYKEMYKADEDSIVTTSTIDDVEYHVIVCSRNLQIKNDEDSHFIKALTNGNVFEKIVEMGKYLGRSIAIQGECMGPGIQGNPEQFSGFRFYAFNIWDIEKRDYIPYDISMSLFEDFEVLQVPNIDAPFKPFRQFETIQELLKYSDGKSINAAKREGIVYKSSGNLSFKVISNDWLLNPDNS